MKSKPIDFSAFKKLQRLSLNEFNRWLFDLCNTVYEDGVNSVSQNSAVELTDERLLEILLSVKGIGHNRAEAVIRKVLNEDTNNGIKT